MLKLLSTVRRLWNHTRSDGLDDDIHREMTFHLRERADELVHRGMSPERARVEARRRFGNVGAQKEQTRERDLFAWLDSIVNDVRYTVRALRAAPVFALVAILSLALGIGANTAIFSIVNSVILKALPVSRPDELVLITKDGSNELTNPLWEAIRDQRGLFAGALAFGETQFDLASGGESRHIAGSWVSGGFFSTLGVRPATGRLIVDTDDQRGCPAIAVLGHGFWQTEYGGADDMVGKTISLGGHAVPIVGVTNAGFVGLNVGARSDVFVPLCALPLFQTGDNPLDDRSYWFLGAVGRMPPGASLASIRARLGALGPGIAAATAPADWPDAMRNRYRGMKLGASPAATGFSDLRVTYTKPLYILMAIAGLVLLVGCANVANLLIARAESRGREIAVRVALGAGRARIARQLITEGLVLSLLGAALGLVASRLGSRVLVALISRAAHPVSLDLTTDGRVLGFTIAVAIVTGLLFGLAPAWRVRDIDPHSAMQAQSRGATGGRARARVGNTIVVGQVALSLVLVMAASLFLVSWRKLATADPGFRANHVLLVSADLSATHLPDDQRRAAFDQILAHLRSTPGVRAASASRLTPISGLGWNSKVAADGFTPKSERDGLTWLNAVGDGYFLTLGTPLLTGRDFDRRDGADASPVAIVNETMARKFFGTPAALGKTFRVAQGRRLGDPVEVIGVVATTKYRAMRDSASAIIYFPLSQQPAGEPRLSFEIRAAGAPLEVIASVKAAFASVNPKIALDIVTFEQQIAESLSVNRTIASLGGVFGALALFLAAIGLYGVTAYNVARRKNEIGIRIALGAARGRVVRMILGEMSRVVIAGAIIGVGLALGASKLVRAFLYGITPNDPATLAGTTAMLLIVSAAAALIPAWRAARLDPVAALRED